MDSQAISETILVTLPAYFRVRSPPNGAEWYQLLRRNVKRFRGGHALKAHRLLYRSTLGSGVIKKKKKSTQEESWSSKRRMTRSRASQHPRKEGGGSPCAFFQILSCSACVCLSRFSLNHVCVSGFKVEGVGCSAGCRGGGCRFWGLGFGV